MKAAVRMALRTAPGAETQRTGRLASALGPPPSLLDEVCGIVPRLPDEFVDPERWCLVFQGN